jgi:hypothetical protein
MAKGSTSLAFRGATAQFLSIHKITQDFAHNQVEMEGSD